MYYLVVISVFTLEYLFLFGWLVNISKKNCLFQDDEINDVISSLPSNLLSLDEEEQKDSDEDMFASVPVKRRCKAQSTIHQPDPVKEVCASGQIIAVNSDVKTDKKKTDSIHCDDQVNTKITLDGVN